MKLIVLVISLLVTQTIFAQDSTRIKIESGQTYGDVITPAKRYRFLSFRQGQVILRDKNAYTSRLNYNLLTGEMDFIAPQGDTLALANQLVLNIERVIVDTISFFYNNGYFEVMKESSLGSVAKRQMYIEASKEKIGAYSLSSPTSAIESYSSFVDRSGRVYDLTARENIIMKLKTEYFFGDPYKLFLPANKRSLDKLYTSKKQQTADYLKKYAIDFTKEDDLKKLFSLLSNN